MRQITNLLTPEIQEALYLKLGELIRRYRDAAGIKQELLASYVDLSRVSIHNIESGKQKVQLHTLLEIAKYLQIPLNDLIHPLHELILNDVNPKFETRITKELKSEKSKEIDTIKQFVNFALTKNKSK